MIQKFSPEKKPEKVIDTGKTMLLNISEELKGEPTEKDSEDKKPGQSNFSRIFGNTESSISMEEGKE